MIWPFRKKAKLKAKKPVTRFRIFMWPFVLCLIATLLNAALPLEELFRGVRDYMHARPADRSIVVVGIDDRTIKHFKTSYYSRKFNSQILDIAFGSGAKRIYFDDSFRLPLDEPGDRDFAAALSRRSGKVFVGTNHFDSLGSDAKTVLEPIEILRPHVGLRSMGGFKSPFQMSAQLVHAEEIRGQEVLSISSDLAGVSGKAGELYRPDWSIQSNSVPFVSVLDVLDRKVPADFFAGKDVVVGVTSQSEGDLIQIIGQGWVPGVYAHVVGAQTLKEGDPIDVGGLPALALAALLSIAILRARTRQQANRLMLASGVAFLAIPFALDRLFIDSLYLPGYCMLAAVSIRSSALRELTEARLRNAGTLLPNLSALREELAAANHPIVAMRIKNYAAVCASFPDSVETDLITELARRLTLPGQTTTFYQAEGVLYWLGPTLKSTELEEHLAGLAQLIESHLIIQGRKLDMHVVFGVDTALTRPVANRIGRALLAADQAAAKHQLVQLHTSENDEESAWELSLMSELDEAIDAGDIWVAYQPQFDLKSDRIVGAEALVRWLHPTRGAISPEAFVLAAEAHNRITRLSFYVLEQAMLAAKPLVTSNPGFRLSVNLSAVLLESPRLPASIVDSLTKTGFPAVNLTLEVTESAPFSEHAVVAGNLCDISNLGIELSIDDYGTGNATLDYLRSVPCHEIKIDRRFVTNLVSSASDLLLVESTIELAHGLGRRVIAEGIEDPETLELLRAIRCDLAQGYYLAKPMRIDALESLLNSNNRLHAA